MILFFLTEPIEVFKKRYHQFHATKLKQNYSKELRTAEREEKQCQQLKAEDAMSERSLAEKSRSKKEKKRRVMGLNKLKQIHNMQHH